MKVPEKLQRLLPGVAILGVVLIVLGLVRGSGHPSSPPIPGDQQKLCAILQQYSDDYRQEEKSGARNEIRLTQLRVARARELRDTFRSSMDVKGWVGKVLSIDTHASGAAEVIIKFPCAPAAVENDMPISMGTPTYETLARVDKGQFVTFDGSFLEGRDFINEKSVSESGSMRSPELMFRFERITRQVRGAQ